MHYFLILALKHRLWVLVRTASLRRVPTINVLSKKKKKKREKHHNFSSENYLYSSEKLLYIAWACFRNGLRQVK